MFGPRKTERKISTGLDVSFQERFMALHISAQWNVTWKQNWKHFWSQSEIFTTMLLVSYATICYNMLLCWYETKSHLESHCIFAPSIILHVCDSSEIQLLHVVVRQHYNGATESSQWGGHHYMAHLRAFKIGIILYFCTGLSIPCLKHNTECKIPNSKYWIQHPKFQIQRPK